MDGWDDPDRADGALERLVGVMHGRRRRNGAMAAPLPELPPRKPREKLTEAEARTLQGLASGLTMSETAEVLGVTHASAQDAVKRARRVLAAKTATHAVAIALREGTIT